MQRQGAGVRLVLGLVVLLIGPILKGDLGLTQPKPAPPPVCLLQAGTHSKGTPGLVTKKLGVFSLELVVCV